MSVKAPNTTPSEPEWFDLPDPSGRTDSGEVGLRFTCTQCGHCCTGPAGFVFFKDHEADAMARAKGVSREVFDARYTRDTPLGRSLKEHKTEHGYDCVFLTRDERTGITGCSVYASRPEQCRTWPFWGSNLRGKHAWRRASEGCPGMDTGKLHSPAHIRITRDRVEI